MAKKLTAKQRRERQAEREKELDRPLPPPFEDRTLRWWYEDVLPRAENRSKRRTGDLVSPEDEFEGREA